MKKLLLFVLSMLFVASSAFAGEYTLTFKGTGTANDGTAAFSASKDITTVVEESNYVTAIKEVANVYTGKEGFGLKFSSGSKNGSITFSLSADGAKKITKVVATACQWKETEAAKISINDAEAQDLTAELADYTFDFTPTENSTTLKINATKRMYVTKLVVTYEEDDSEVSGPAAPVIKMAAGNMVEISAAEGAQIYYTLTGEDPTVDNGTLYDGAFRINDAVQVKAIAVVEGKSSSVANFSAYLNTVTSIDELIELNDLTHTLTLEAPLTIVYHNGRYMYVNQDNAWLLLYGVNSDNTYANGAQLASVTGSFTLYRSLIPEMTNVELGDVTEGGTPVEATAMTIADINSFGATPALMNYFVKFEGVTIDLDNTKLVQDGSELTYYNQFALTLPEATEGKTYNVEGFISYYGEAVQLNIINVTEVEEPETPGVEYTAPSGNPYTDNYLTAITSTGAQENISYTADSHPGIYSVLEAPIVATPGSEFSIEFVAKSLGEGSTTTVREDMRFNAAYIFADWYGNGEFTFIEKYGKTAPDHNVYGNYDYVMDINQAFTMPEDVNAGTAARIRIIYQNAWKGCGGNATSSTPDPNASNLDKGIAYDIVVNAAEAPAPTYAVTIAETEATVSANVEDLTAVEEGTEVIFTITAPEGKQIVSVTYNDETLTANEDGTYTVTVNADGTLAVTLEDIPEPGKSILVPETSGNTLYGFRFDDAVLGSHNNGSCDANDLRSHSFTYSAWVKPMNTSGRIMGNIQTDWTTTDGAFWVYLKDGKLTLGGRGNDADNEWKAQENISISASADPGTEVGEWVFISVVADQTAKTVTLYKNCKPVCSYEVNNKIGLLPDKASFYVGDGGCSVALTEVQLWNKALTSDELMDTYDFHYTETPENLAAYYKVTELVEGSTTDLRNLGTVATDVPAQLLQATNITISGWIPGFGNPQPQVIEPIDEDRVLGTAAITLVQPESEGNSFAVVNANGKVLGSEVTLFEKLNVASTLAEGIEVLGVIVETEGQTTTYTLDQLPIRATGDMTISLRLNDLYKVVATAENATVSIAVNDGEATALPAEGINVANGSKVVLTFVPAADMVFKSFTVNGEEAELTDNTYTIDAIDADYTFAAVYKAFTYKLIVINPTDADVPENNVYGEFVDNTMEPLEYDEAEGIEVAPGDRAFLNILPAENHGTTDSYYMFEALTDNGVEVSGTELLPSGNGYVYPIFNIDSDHVLVITQSLYNGIVGVVADAEGMISFSDYTIRVAADNAQIDIFDLNGSTLRSVAANEITVSDLVKGVYFAKATVNGKVYTLKFIKL